MGTILIVEDNADMRDEIVDLLEFAGWSTLSASNGLECLEIAGKQDLELIVCDVYMPQMDGYETLSRLRSDEKTAHIPFVFVTAVNNVDQVCNKAQITPDRVLRKPFEARILFETIQRLIS